MPYRFPTEIRMTDHRRLTQLITNEPQLAFILANRGHAWVTGFLCVELALAQNVLQPHAVMQVEQDARTTATITALQTA